MRNFAELVATLKTKVGSAGEVKALNELFGVDSISPDLWTNHILSDKKNFPISYGIIMEGLKSSNSEGWQTLVGKSFEVKNYQVKTLSNGSVLTLAILSDGRRISVNKSFVSLIEADKGVTSLYISAVDKAEIKSKSENGVETKVYASCTLTLEKSLALPSDVVLQKIKAIPSIDGTHLEKWEKTLSVEMVASPVASKEVPA